MMAATKLRMASHQMCQMSEKPKTVAKKAVTNPAGLLCGNSIASYAGFGGTRPVRFICQNASMDSTLGSTAKLYAGGGEVVDHSSVRPFHGSPVRSRRCSRVRMLT